MTCFYTEQLQNVPRVFTQKLAGVLQRSRVRINYILVLYWFITDLLMYIPIWLLFLGFKFYRNRLIVLDVLEGQTHTISLPISLKSVFLAAEDRWLLVENETNRLVKPSFLDATISCLCLFYVQEFHSWSQSCFFTLWEWLALNSWCLRCRFALVKVQVGF